MVRLHRSRNSSLRALRDVDKAFDRAFRILDFITNRFIIDHLFRSERRLGGHDFELLVIWGVLAHQNVAHLMPQGSLPTAILIDRGRLTDTPLRLRPQRLCDIAQITGLPRETTRRKLEQLAANRRVEHTPDGWMVSADWVEAELRDFTRESVLRLLATADEIMAALQDADRYSVHRR